MPRLYTKLSIYTAFTVMFVLLLLNAATTRRQLGLQLEKRGWSDHSRRVLLSVSEVGSLLTDAETGQRGYLYTGDPGYLQPYQASSDDVMPAIQRLAELTADNPEQQVHIGRIRDLSQQKLAELAKTISLSQSGQSDEARRLVSSNVGKSVMDQIRKELAAMWKAESDLSSARDEEYQRSVTKTTWSIYLATLAAVLGLMFLAHYVLLQIQQRERYTAAIREREEWFRVTLGSIGDGVLATDEEGKVTFINQIAQALTGFQPQEVAGKHVSEVFPIFNEQTHQPAENPVAKVFAHGRIVGLANHTVLRHRDGRLIPIEDSAAPIRNDENKIVGVVLVFRDATYERHAQQLLRRAEKLATAGRLASTMAHEINNPLEAVCNLIFIAKNSANVPAEILDHLSLAEQQLERVAHITRQTLGFYREPSMPQDVQISDLVESVLVLYDNKLRSKRITVERDFRDVPLIPGLSGELKQLIANLISNAADAVAIGGKLTISILPTLDGDRSAVEMRVQDNGPGIAPENRERIFEPFFTTKTDVGTGLGLWVVKEIAERHGGTVRLLAPEGQQSGAIFSVILPVIAEPEGLSTTA